MKNLIYQYFVPYTILLNPNENKTKEFPEWAKIGRESAKNYADTIGAEYMFQDKKYMNEKTLNVFESFRIIFDETFDEYDNILLLDIDMIVNTKEDIFKIKVDDIGMVHEAGVYNRPPMKSGPSFDKGFWNRYFNHPISGVTSYAKKYVNPFFVWEKSKLYSKEPFALYNGGLQLWSKQGRLKARETFKIEGHNHFREVTGKTETPYLNMMLFANYFGITEISNEWNRLHFQWEKDGNMGKITHYNGVKDMMIDHEK